MEKPSKGLIATRIVMLVLISLGMIGFFAAVWYRVVYGDVGFDAVFYALKAGPGDVASDLLIQYILWGLLPAVVLTPSVYFFLFHFPLEVEKREEKGRRYLFPHKIAVLISSILVVVLLTGGIFYSGLAKWAYLSLSETDIYEKEYVDPNSVSIEFPEQKRNIIYIYLESMETTFLSEELGGGIEHTTIPELYNLAQTNINFSHNSMVGGGRTLSGTTWTVGALVAHTSGLPLKFTLTTEDGEDQYDNFLPGVTTITDILKEQGYYQTIMFGSRGEYGGRTQFFQQHGIDKVYDLRTAYEDGIVPDGYKVWWGMEDKHLIEYAKQELLEISKGEKPFAFSMLTVDTHHIDGYLCDECENKFEAQYDNVMACSSKRIYEFVEWIKQQDFYENTTIVITGDHCSMDEGYISEYMQEDYIRRVYNCDINPHPELTINDENIKNRAFATIDMFPTTLAAMGCKIEGNRLGIGTNLFAGVPTLCERYEFDKLSDELAKHSEFYDKQLMQLD